MKRALAGILFCACLIAAAVLLPGAGPAQPAGEGPWEFVAVEVRVDPRGAALAAYQVEVVLAGARLVGVEGGEADAFGSPPTYDPAALHGEGGERVIVAAVGGDAGRPTGESVVAVLHFMIETGSEATPTCTLIAAGDGDAKRIEATSRATLMRAPAKEGVEP